MGIDVSVSLLDAGDCQSQGMIRLGSRLAGELGHVEAKR